MAEWSAEISVDAGLARRLIAEQFPELGPGSLTLAGEGWDVTAWLVDGRWLFRFPRRAIGLPGFEREPALLPLLAPRLPLPIPQPAFVGRPSERYPWPFLGSPYVAGRELCDAGLGATERVRLAAPLAGFLRVLHGPETAATVATLALPEDPNGRADMALRVPRTVEWLDAVEELGLWRRPASLEPVLAAALALPPARATAVTHGDLHFRHLIVDGAGALAGVIDWGDACLADPAIDLQLVWSLFPPEGRGAFLAAYGPVDEAMLLRARVLALCLCAALAVSAHDTGLRTVEREAVAGLERAGG